MIVPSDGAACAKDGSVMVEVRLMKKMMMMTIVMMMMMMPVDDND